jgi:protein-L-isoaspartate(D-aspartate) O-methyltransferase
VERVRDLSIQARKTLDELKYHNVALRVGDGSLGWREHAPFDAVIVTAGAPDIPPPLIEQLKEGGKMAIPVGNQYSQKMMIGIKEGKDLVTKDIGGYRFVDLKGTHGW